jgi:transposase-like protein
MTKERRKFSPEDRLSILKEAKKEGKASTITKYQIAPSLYTRWKRKYLQEGITGSKDQTKE